MFEIELPSLGNAVLNARGVASKNLGHLSVFIHEVGSHNIDVLLLGSSGLSEFTGELLSEGEPSSLGSLSLLSESGGLGVISLDFTSVGGLAVWTSSEDALVPSLGVAALWGSRGLHPGVEGIDGWSEDCVGVSVNSKLSILGGLHDGAGKLLSFWLLGLLLSPSLPLISSLLDV